MRGLVPHLLAIAALFGAAVLAASPASAETLTLRGVMTGANHQTYREVPFRVPAGTASITIAFSYTGKDQKAVIDLGLRDPARFRGWSGGNKSVFTVAETWATPSYLPGPLPAGEWKLILGVPNLRKDTKAEYTATVTLARQGTFHGFPGAPDRAGPGWYRGDLHLHTGHSDGSCASQRGARVPCPTFRTLEAAAARGLDFVVVTDHNTTSHFQDLAELQPYYDGLLLIPGREVTTFQGHANIIGTTAPLEFQLGTRRAPTFNDIAYKASFAGGMMVINHPGLPSGEACMGCGWTAKMDLFQVDAIEIVNGGALAQTGSAEGPFSSLPFWEARLNAGDPVVGIAGSDNHDAGLDPGRAASVGRPTTVVRAARLSADGIRDGIRSGQVFIDVEGTRDRLLEVEARKDGRGFHMGDGMGLAKGEAVPISVHVAHAAGARIVFSGPAAAGVKAESEGPLSDDETRRFTLTGEGGAGWLRADVRGPDGKLWLIGNPIYLY